MKKTKPLFLLAGLTLLASCGGGSSSPSPSAPSESSATQASSSVEVQSSSPKSAEESSNTSAGSSSASSNPDAGKKVTIPFWHTFGATPEGELKEKAALFSEIMLKETGVEVEIVPTYQGGYKDILTKITNSLSVSCPTIAVAYPDHVANYLAAEGSNPGRYVCNIEEFFDDSSIGFNTQSYLGDTSDAVEDDFIEAYISEGRSYAREGVYSLPYMKSSEVMFYNIEAVEKTLAIYDPSLPAGDYKKFLSSMDWDTFMDVCKVALDNKSTIDSLMDYPAYYDSDGNLFISQMFQSEIDYASIGNNGKGVVDFESGSERTRAEELVSGLLKNHNDHLLTTKGIEGTYGSNSFVEMKSIFSIGSSGGAGYNDPATDAFHVGVVPVPAKKGKDGERNPLYVTQGPTLTFLRSAEISKEENDLRLRYAWQFAKYLTNTDINVEVTMRGSEGYVPVRYSCYETSLYSRFMSNTRSIFGQTANVLFNDIGDNYLVSKVFKGSAELREAAGGIFASVATGQKATVTDAFNDAINVAKGYMS